MTCGILLVTHPGVGASLLDVATRLLRQLPLKAEAFEVPFDADLDALLPLASAAHPALAPLLTVQSFYRAINALALRRGHNPDLPPHLNKVTETV